MRVPDHGSGVSVLCTTSPKFDPGFGNKRRAGGIDNGCHADHAHVDSTSSATYCASSGSSCGGGATYI
jgi:hypothetical protein